MTRSPQPTLVLYHAWSSSASRKVRLCLAEKGLGHDGRVLDLRRFQPLTTDHTLVVAGLLSVKPG